MSWDQARLDGLISNKIEESNSLDYKAAAALQLAPRYKKEIVKDVTAFANSNGGTIIYGISEHKEHELKHLAERIDPVDRSQFSREWLEQVISQAQPRIENVIIHHVPLQGTPSGSVYVVEIPRSDTAHQCTDGRYYRRYNFESVFMQDHEIRDVMNRRGHPRLLVEARLRIRPAWEKSLFLIRVRNVGPRMARDYEVQVELPLCFDEHRIGVDGAGVVMGEADDGACFLSFSLGQGLRRTPLFPGKEVILRRAIRSDVKEHVRVDGKPMVSTSDVRLTCFADEMPALVRVIPPSLLLDQWG